MFVVFPIIFAVVVAASWKQMNSVRATWDLVSTDLGLSLTTGGFMSPPKLEGTVDGVHLNVDVNVANHGNNRAKWTRYTVHHFPVGPPLTLSKQGTFSFLRKWTGGVDQEVGNPFFDDSVVIDSDDAYTVQMFLTPARQAAVLNTFAKFEQATFTEDSLVVSTRGLQDDRQAMVSTLRWLIDIASVMGEPQELGEALEWQHGGDLTQAAERLHEFNATNANAFTQHLEAEAWAEVGDHESAAGIFSELGRALPGDEDVQQWQRVTSAPSPQIATPDAPLRAGQSPDQQLVVDDLFDPNRRSWEIVEHFESRYQNAIVSWSGTVTTYSPYRHDSDFGEGPGIKATVLLGTVGRSRFLSAEVHAILELPAIAEIRRGDEISFTGSLATVDRFSRKLHIRSASLID